ncbi:MAG: hypothetical protein U0T83_00860 [Bacteriovoracaceae bacterium]
MKNWLIRTRNHRILGPITKEKLIELYESGSLSEDDEICSGNGYWFYVKEIALVEKYVKGDIVQSFNPISEAKSVLTKSQSETVEDESGPKLPNSDDLDYPDI